MTIKVENRRIATVKLTDAESFSRVAKVNADSALNSAQLAEQSKIDAEIAQNAAQSSANNANIDANQAEQDRIQTGIDRAATEGFRDSAEAAKNAAEGFRDQAEGFRDDSQGLRNQAEIARDVTEGFRDNAEAARDAAEGFRDQAEGFRNQAEIARDASEGFRDTAEGHKNDAETAAQAAEAARDDAQAAVADLTPFQDAVTKAHDQNTDTALDEGGPNEVTAATLADLASAERREQFFQTVLQPVGVNTPPDVLYWPTPYRAIGMDATAVRAGSDATFFDRFGVLQNADPDTFRRDFDPATGAFKGALAEPQRTNLLLRSEDFGNAVWSKFRTTITPSAIASPDGALNASKLVENTDLNSHVLNQNVTVTSGATYTMSVYLKQGERRFVALSDSAVSVRTTTFDLELGTVVAQNSGILSSAIDPVGNGWFRCAMTFVAASTTIGARVGLMDATGTFTPSYTGDGTSGIYIWGAQLEQASFASSYIKTEATTVTRPADTLTIPQVGDRRRGLIVWQGVMRFGLSGNAMQFPFGVTSNSASTRTTHPRQIAGFQPRAVGDSGFSTTGVTTLSDISARVIRVAYWWDVDAAVFGVSADGVSNTNASAVFTGSVSNPVRFGQTAISGIEGSSHTDWIYISYNVPPIAQIEALTGAVL